MPYNRSDYSTQEAWLDALADNAAELTLLESCLLCVTCGREVPENDKSQWGYGGMCIDCARTWTE